MRAERPQDDVPTPADSLFAVAVRENQRELTQKGLTCSSWDMDREPCIFRVTLQPINSAELKAEEIRYRRGIGKNFSEAIRNAIDSKG